METNIGEKLPSVTRKSVAILNYKMILGKSLQIRVLSTIQQSEKESEIPKD